MRVRRLPPETAELNLTPMIDCLLFLVVFLLMATTFNKHSRLNLMLPEATGVAEAKKMKKIEVAITSDGKYAVDGEMIGDAEEAELSASLKAAMDKKGVVPLVIAADAKAAHQDVVRVMDVAGKLGLANINISTKVPSGASK